MTLIAVALCLAFAVESIPGVRYGASRREVEASLAQNATPCPSFILGHFGTAQETVWYAKLDLSVTYSAEGTVVGWSRGKK